MNNKQRRLIKKIARIERIMNEHKLMVARGEEYLKYLKDKNKDIIKETLNILKDKIKEVTERQNELPNVNRNCLDCVNNINGICGIAILPVRYIDSKNCLEYKEK